MLSIDGATGEGGGQILRSSLALSLLTGQPFRMTNVRANRSKPGLQPQHLASLTAAATIGGTEIEGLTKGSSEVVFRPGKVKSGQYKFDIGTAGSTSLVLQTVYLPLLLRGTGRSEVTIIGGTHVPAAPCFQFLATTWAGFMHRMGLEIELHCARPGFFPKGGGQIMCRMEPASEVVSWTEPACEPTPPGRISGFSATCGFPPYMKAKRVAERQAEKAGTLLRAEGFQPAIRVEDWDAPSSGTVLALILDCTPVPTLFFALGEHGKRAETVAEEAVGQLLQHWRLGPMAVDPHSADQLILPLAFARGKSAFAVSVVTPHLLTNIDIVKKFTSRKITCTGELGEPGKVKIE